MFVAVATICPVVRCDESSAASTDNPDEKIPDVVLNEFIEEELQAISDMAEEQLMEEYGVTMEQYQESMEALSGNTLVLVGDENGNISVEVSETIDRGRGGSWIDGNYFYFGIESFAWSAIKWWFSDDCINMIVDQLSQGDLDAIAVAEKEFNDIVNSIIDIGVQISNLNNTLETITENIILLEDMIASYTQDVDRYYDDAIGSAEEAASGSESAIEELETEADAIEASSEAISNVSVDDLVYCTSDALLKLSEIVTASEFIKMLFNGQINENVKDTKGFTLSAFFVSAVNGDVKGMSNVICDVIEEKGIVFCTKAITGDLEEVKKMLDDAKNELRNDIDDIKSTNKAARNAINDAISAKNEASIAEADAVKDDKKVNEELNKVNNEKDFAQTSKDKSEKKYNDLKKSLSEIEEKYNNGSISEAEYKVKYECESNKLKLAESDYKSKCADLSLKERKVSALKLDSEHSLEKITNERVKILSEENKILEGKKVLKDNKVKTLKSSFNAAKSGIKAAAKATAKAGCKAAICATGIGAVISVALDIVMALLIKFIEDHISSQGDIYEDYGIMVKVQVFEKYTVHQTIRIFWRTVTIHFDVIAPCVPRLDGVYKQW